jgi:hypothetical protein
MLLPDLSSFSSSGNDFIKSPRSMMVRQCVFDERIGFSHDIYDRFSADRRSQHGCNINKQPSTSYRMVARVVNSQKDNPNGFMASVIIC